MMEENTRGKLRTFGRKRRTSKPFMSLFDKNALAKIRAVKKLNKTTTIKIAGFISDVQSLIGEGQYSNTSPMALSKYDEETKTSEDLKIILVATGANIKTISDLYHDNKIYTTNGLKPYIVGIHHLLINAEDFSLYDENGINEDLHTFNKEFDKIIDQLINILIENPDLSVKEAMDLIIKKLEERQATR